MNLRGYALGWGFYDGSGRGGSGMGTQGGSRDFEPNGMGDGEHIYSHETCPYEGLTPNLTEEDD